ncbi:extracellular solute-binding protein [Streptomyces sp. MN03-5084-2B]|nr:extracellular solute-binding protein [Streptomyces sp. MN03-5084-2B]
MMRRSRLLVAASLAAVVSLVLGVSSAVAGAPASGRKIVINTLFSIYDFPGLDTTLIKRGKEFEKAHPQYKVNVKFAYYQRLPEDVEKAALNGETPAIASYNISGTQFALDTLDQNGKPAFTSVSQAIAGRKKILGEQVVVDDLVPAGRRYYSRAGDLFAMPLSLSTLQLYVNKTLLDKAGVKTIPRTYAEMSAACAALKKLPNGPKSCVALANEGKLYMQALAQQGVNFANNDNGRSGRATTVDLNSSALVDYTTWWQQMHRDGNFLYSGQMEDWPGTFGAFASQEVAFTVTSSFAINYGVDAAKAANFEFVVAPSPAKQVPYAGAWLGGEGMYLAAGLDDATRDGALAFMQFVNKPKNGAEWHRVYGASPVTNGAYKELKAEGYYKDHPQHLATVEQIYATTAVPGGQSPLVGGFAGIQQALMRAVDDILEKNADPLERLTRAESIAQELLTDYNDHCVGPGLRPTTCFLLDS